MKIRTATIELGERTFEVKELGWRAAAKWRSDLLAGIEPLFENAASMSDIKLETPEDMLKLWPLIEGVMESGIDVLLDHLLAYSDTLADQREYIEEHATVAQVSAAFVEVAKYSIPFEALNGLRQATG